MTGAHGVLGENVQNHVEEETRPELESVKGHGIVVILQKLIVKIATITHAQVRSKALSVEFFVYSNQSFLRC